MTSFLQTILLLANFVQEYQNDKRGLQMPRHTEGTDGFLKPHWWQSQHILPLYLFLILAVGTSGTLYWVLRTTGQNMLRFIRKQGPAPVAEPCPLV